MWRREAARLARLNYITALLSMYKYYQEIDMWRREAARLARLKDQITNKRFTQAIQK